MIQETEQLIHELFGLEMSMISVNVWDSKANSKFTEIIENIDVAKHTNFSIDELIKIDQIYQDGLEKRL